MSASVSLLPSADAPTDPVRPDEVRRAVPLPNGANRYRRYDLLGRQRMEEEPDGSWRRYRYDAQGDLKQVIHSSGQRVDYAFDRERHEWRAQNGAVETTLRCDADEMPIEIVTRIHGKEWRIATARDAQGRVTACRYPQSVDWLRFDRPNADTLIFACGTQTYCRIEGDAHQTQVRIRYCSGAETTEVLTPAPAATPVAPQSRLSRLIVRDGCNQIALDLDYVYGGDGKLREVGADHAAYDAGGRLIDYTSPAAARAYRYDERGRLLTLRVSAERDSTRFYDYVGDMPMVAACELESGRHLRYEYDKIGRRIARHTAAKENEGGVPETTRYVYDLFGQLTAVEMPDGRAIRYLYDGFGRLVGRAENEHWTYYLVDLDGNRLAEADETGRIVASYLWVGAQCVARIEGVMGEPLTETFHRVHGGLLAAVGDAQGRLERVSADDPFGADSPLRCDAPTYAGLFGDPVTGLLYAGGRWLDPTSAQFLTPDSWYGGDTGLPGSNPLTRLLDALPGGTARLLTPETAYNWCAHDPLNFSDPNGHNWLGLIFSTISALFWEMQLTGISLQMEVINILLTPLLELIHLFSLFGGGSDFFWNFSIFNIAAPTASYRLMVPLALPLNGLLRFHDRGWTLGSVIWVRGAKWRSVDASGKRELLLCSNAATYLAATESVATDSYYRVRNAGAQASGKVNAIGGVAAGGLLDTLAPIAPPAGPVTDVFHNGDWVAIRLAGGEEEHRTIAGLPAGITQIQLDGPALPAGFAGQNVTITRLDFSVVKIAGSDPKTGDKVLARTVTFVRGTAIHFARHVPENFFADGPLGVTELLPTGALRQKEAAFPVEQTILRLDKPEDRNGYAANDFVRLLNGSDYFARQVKQTRAVRDLEIDTSLPKAVYTSLEMVKLAADGVPAAAQTGNLKRVRAGNLTGIQAYDGLAIENTGGAPAVTTERRIVLKLFLDCQLDPLDAKYHNVGVKVDKMIPDVGTQATGTVTSGTQITATKDQVKRFEVGQPVRIRKAPDTDFLGVVDTIALDVADPADAGKKEAVLKNLINLKAALPAADFPLTTAVTVTLLKAGGDKSTFDAENIAPPGDHVVVAVDIGTALTAKDIVRIRLTADKDGLLRSIKAAPVVTVDVNDALPATHVANLTVQRFTPDKATLRKDVAAPEVRRRLTVTVAPNPFVAGDTVFIKDSRVDGEETWGTVDTIPAATPLVIVLKDPVELPFNPAPVTLTLVAPTGLQTPDGKLEEGLVLIPSDPNREPLRHREAFENHEMRHVWQGAVWGPFLLSLPLPWLINLGFSFTKFAHSGSQVLRHISVGGLDSAFAALAWGIGGSKSPTHLPGTVADDSRKVIQFTDDQAALAAKFTDGSRISLLKAGKPDSQDVFNVVDKLDTPNHAIQLRFALDSDGFAKGDTVNLTVSPFEQIRKTVSTLFSLNLEELWSDHIPTAWGRALSKLLDRDSWFPGLGIYPLSLIKAGFDETRLPNEQDAAYHSGDLYSTIVKAESPTFFVGQFARIFAFLHPRGSDEVRTLSSDGPLGLLAVELPAGVKVEDVSGAIPHPFRPNYIRFRENWYLPMSERAENVVGALFSASQPGDYQLHANGQLPPGTEIVFKFAFDVNFISLSKFTVNKLTLSPDPMLPVFETEEIPFAITGDSSAEYLLRFTPGGAVPKGSITGLHYKAPLLPAGTPSIAQDIQITATYKPEHPVFNGPGQSAPAQLTVDQRTNLCQQFSLTVKALTAPPLGPVKAGSVTDFQVDLAPVAINMKPAPAGVTGVARVLNLGGRPAKLKFVAPPRIAAAAVISFELVFGSDPANRKTVPFDVNVTP